MSNPFRDRRLPGWIVQEFLDLPCHRRRYGVGKECDIVSAPVVNLISGPAKIDNWKPTRHRFVRNEARIRR